MTMVCSSYIFIAPEGFHFAWHWVCYLLAGIVTLGSLVGFRVWARNLKKAK
jgi:hypothetical protein